MGGVRDQVCLQQVSEATRRIDFRRYEEGQTDPPENLLYAVLDILDDGLRIAAKIQSDYEERCRSGQWQPRNSAEAGDAADLPQQKVADVCFMACVELRGKVQPLSLLREKKSFGVEIFVLCSDALRKVRKVAAAIEKELCRCTGLKSALHTDGEVESGIEIRRAFAALRKAVLGLDPPAEGGLEERLRISLSAIEDLMGQSLFYALRFSDRHQLRQIWRRVHDWLSQKEGWRLEPGLILWQDLAGFTELLKGINNRSELQEHDRAAVLEVQRLLLNSGEKGKCLPLRVHLLAATLFGRFDRLDHLLEQGNIEEAAWRPLFDTLATQLEPVQQPSFLLRDAV